MKDTRYSNVKKEKRSLIYRPTEKLKQLNKVN